MSGCAAVEPDYVPMEIQATKIWNSDLYGGLTNRYPRACPGVSIFNPGMVLVAFLFSAAVGVIFGYFPARKAAQLDPIEALRHE